MNIRIPRAGTILGVLALVLAMAGTATAAKKVIDGKLLKKGSVSTKAIKDKTIKLSDISSDARKSLRGKTGAKGDTGAPGTPGVQGIQGIQGVQGERGPSEATHLTLASRTVNGGFSRIVINSASLPAGSYVVTAKASLTSPATAEVRCEIINNATTLDEARVDPVVGNTQSVALQAAFTQAAPGNVTLGCTEAGGDLTVEDAALTIIRVGALG